MPCQILLDWKWKAGDGVTSEGAGRNRPGTGDGTVEHHHIIYCDGQGHIDIIDVYRAVVAASVEVMKDYLIVGLGYIDVHAASKTNVSLKRYYRAKPATVWGRVSEWAFPAYRD
jgi:hypothetical protein